MTGVRALAGTANYWLCRNARRALHEALRRQRRSPGQKLWMPAFMCRVVLAPARAAGFDIRLYDVDERFEPVDERLELHEGDAFLAVHFFGIVQSLTDRRDQLRARGVTLIEDCAHLLKPGYGGSRAGYVGDWSIFSFRKQLPVTCGGMLLGQSLNDGIADAALSYRPGIRDLLIFAERVGPRIAGSYYSRAVEWTRDALDPVRGHDVETWCPEHHDAIPATALRVMRSLDLDAIARKRRENYRTLVGLLDGVEGVEVPVPELPAGSVPMALPILVHRGRRTASAMWAAGVGAFLWPGLDALAGVSWDEFPGSRVWLDRLVCLPVHQDLDASQLVRVRDACAAAVSRTFASSRR